MKNAPMRFDGLSLSHNPHKLLIENESRLRELTTVKRISRTEQLYRRPCVISGEGELYGADCLEQYIALERMYRSQKRGKLALPHLRPIYAYLKELSLLSEPHEDVLKYRFVFVEAQSPRLRIPEEAYYITVSQGESLWDIGYRYGVGIDDLVRLNPQIPHIDELDAEERVRLC